MRWVSLVIINRAESDSTLVAYGDMRQHAERDVAARKGSPECDTAVACVRMT